MLWNGIRSMINVQNSKFNNISQNIQNGQTIKNPKDIAESLNQYFVNVAENIDRKLPEQGNAHLTIWVSGIFIPFLFPQLMKQKSSVSYPKCRQVNQLDLLVFH